MIRLALLLAALQPQPQPLIIGGRPVMARTIRTNDGRLIQVLVPEPRK